MMTKRTTKTKLAETNVALERRVDEIAATISKRGDFCKNIFIAIGFILLAALAITGLVNFTHWFWEMRDWVGAGIITFFELVGIAALAGITFAIWEHSK